MGRRVAFPQDGAVGEEGNLHAVTLDDRRPPRFFEVAAAADDLDALLFQERDGIEQRFLTPVHRVVAGNGDDVEAAVAEDRCQGGLYAAVGTAGVDLHVAAVRVDPLTLAEADVRRFEDRLCQGDVLVHRLVDWADIADRQEGHIVRCCCGHLVSLLLLLCCQKRHFCCGAASALAVAATFAVLTLPS